MTTPKRSIAIIGIGPRGSFALERLILELSKRKILRELHILLFDAGGQFGYGPVYGLNQNDANWLNISERVLLLERRPVIKFKDFDISSFPSYHDWIGEDLTTIQSKKIDIYPVRSKLGSYLQERFQSLIIPLQKENLISLISGKIIKINNSNIGLTLDREDGIGYENIDEVLLTIGHQPTVDSSQITEWKKFVNKNQNLSLFSSPYPLRAYLNGGLDYSTSIGIRGFGLAMIDIMRGIANSLGTFELTDSHARHYSFSTPHSVKNLIIPFSLDGLPAVPKPLNYNLDKMFHPSEKEIISFENYIGDISIQKEAVNTDFLIEAFAPIAARVYFSLPKNNEYDSITEDVVIQIVRKWLNDDQYIHPTIVRNDLIPYRMMHDFAGMATGIHDISLDYCIGQVWRHCQPSIYEKLSYNHCIDSVVLDIVKLDEKMKRYSFGPPVDSIQQLLALVDAEVLNLNFISNPTIKLSSQGWKLSNDINTVVIKTMINSVLDAPVIKDIDSTILKNLLENNIITVVHDELGIDTDKYGFISSEENSNLPIAVLGRLAKGTIIGVDAILECFGNRPITWASKAADHHEEFINNSGI